MTREVEVSPPSSRVHRPPLFTHASVAPDGWDPALVEKLREACGLLDGLLRGSADSQRQILAEVARIEIVDRLRPQARARADRALALGAAPGERPDENPIQGML